jgi:Ca-activated chloride channel homolog
MELQIGIAEYAAIAVFMLVAIAELVHWGRVKRLAGLSFGPSQRARTWTKIAPLSRVIASGMLAWGLVSLLLLDPKVHNTGQIEDEKRKHLVLVVDVSPSMYLDDAGPEKENERRQRVASLLQSMFSRIPIRQYKVSVIAVYTEARPVVEDSDDIEVIRHVVETIPMHQAFVAGKTDLFKGLALAANMSKNWNPKSTIVVLMTDGDSVPPKGMPRMPPSVSKILVVGVGDERTGRFIDGHQSRQDVNTLRLVANRLGGIYHNGNQKHISSQTIAELMQFTDSEEDEKWSRREYALMFTLIGSTVLAFMPLMLDFLGTGWKPGKKMSN